MEDSISQLLLNFLMTGTVPRDQIDTEMWLSLIDRSSATLSHQLEHIQAFRPTEECLRYIPNGYLQYRTAGPSVALECRRVINLCSIERDTEGHEVTPTHSCPKFKLGRNLLLSQKGSFFCWSWRCQVVFRGPDAPEENSWEHWVERSVVESYTREELTADLDRFGANLGLTVLSRLRCLAVEHAEQKERHYQSARDVAADIRATCERIA